MSAPDLSTPLRTALVGSATITTHLPAHDGSFPIFTRRPVDPTAPYPMIVISPDIASTDEDGVNDYRPVIERDVAVYGRNDTASKYRTVETLARAVRSLFHRQRQSITVSGWTVTGIRATGPIPGSVDDDATIARVVTLTVQLASQQG